MNKKLFLALAIAALLCIPAMSIQASSQKTANPDPYPVANIMVGTYSIDWLPTVSAEGFSLAVSGPGDFFWAETFAKGTRPRFAIADMKGQCLDGQYYYDLKALPQAQPRTRQEQETDFSLSPAFQPLETQSGSFRVQGGSFLSMSLSENAGKVMDVVHADDVIITGSQCVGFDCLTDGTENFGFDTIKMKENNIRLFFDDTSSTAGFPANDWRIIANDSSSGGANYLAIEDSTGAKTPFKIVAGARTSSIFVSSTGRVGLGTSTPVLNLHIVQGDTPSIRLDQDTSSGWTAQVWDIAGNESNFFIRDTTGGSKLPFRIQPGTPTNTLTMKSDGKVGMGTWSPEAQFEIEKTGENAAVIFQRTDGATGKFTARPSEIYMGTNTNHPVRMVANNVVVMSITPDGYVGIGQASPTHKLDVGASGAYCNGGAWVDGSSRQFKSGIRELKSADAVRALADLAPVRFTYKEDLAEERLGFIAEEVPELVAMNNRQGLSAMDIVAVLTKVVQEQQQTIAELSSRLQKLEDEKQK
jgi:hypothetical protein